VRTHDSEVAEVAIEVIDEWQRRGVGKLLSAELRLRALEAGVRRFEWRVLESNRAVAALSRELSNCRRVHIGDDVIQCSGAITRRSEMQPRPR